MNINKRSFEILKIILIVILILVLFKGVSFSKGTEKEKETKYKHIINKFSSIILEDDIEYKATTNLSDCVKACNENKDCKGYILMPDHVREDGKTTCRIRKLLNEDELEDIDYSRNINMKSYTKQENGTYKEDTFKISKMYENSTKFDNEEDLFDNEEKCKEECTNKENCKQYLTFPDKSCYITNSQVNEGAIINTENALKVLFSSPHIFVKE